MTPDQLRLLNTVEHHIAAQRPSEARKILDRLSPLLGNEPRIWWYEAALAQMAGDSQGAEAALKRTAELDPDTPFAMAALGELYFSQDRVDLAEQAWREALSRDRRFMPALLNLVEWLTGSGRAGEALKVLDSAGMDPPDPALLTLRAGAMDALGRFEAALDDYRAAVTASRRAPAVLQNLATALLAAGQVQAAEAAARDALTTRHAHPGLWQILAQALLSQDRFDEAQAALESALERDPLHPGAHRELAQLVWMRTGDLAATMARLDVALAAAPDPAPLQVLKAKFLEYAGDQAGARRILTEAAARPQAPNYVLCAASQILTTSNRTLAADLAAQAVERAPRDRFGLATLAQAQLAAGDLDGAEATSLRIRNLDPTDQHGLALLATTWRLKQDPRAADLNDYSTLVSTTMIETPEGWADLPSYLADLELALGQKHGLLAHPIGQSVRGGIQTNVRLELADDPALKAFFKVIDAPIRAYIAALGQGDDPLRSRLTKGYRLAGSWSVRLSPGGRHVDHLHHKGWISSAFYVGLPAAVTAEGRQGSLRFGKPATPTRPALEAEYWVKPQPGMLALFPSYMWHGTEPFEGESPRLTIAFDVVPEPALTP
ncbi:MAG: tetratricopeptide repeat protein [Caulobacter sp.]|nr:tetratricopeptide repeat protein [Caulobacter sp.]